MSDRRWHDPYAPQDAQEPAEDADSQAPAEEPAAPETVQEAPTPADEADVPEKAEDVVAWVGDDTSRAQAALAVEARREKPRKTVQALDKLLAEG